jgi:hypothetical protein
MTCDYTFYKFSTIPAKGIDKDSIFAIIGPQIFVVVYDALNSNTLIGIKTNPQKDRVNEIERIVPGVKFELVNNTPLDVPQKLEVLSFYKRPKESGDHTLSDFFELAHSGFLAVVFIPVVSKALEDAKDFIEKTLSRRSVKETYSSFKSALASRVSVASHMDIFIGSEETMLLSDTLESINNTLLNNGTVYKTFFIIPQNFNEIQEFVNSRFLILSASKCAEPFDELISKLDKTKSLPFGMDHLKYLLEPYGASRLSYTIPTTAPSTKAGIEIGTFMKSGVSKTNLIVRIAPSTLNLGFMITGLPGTGKTTEAMAIIDELLKGEFTGSRLKVIIITPTDEWNSFAVSHGMYLLKLYDDRVPFNFFRRPRCIDSARFYENLAMVLSSASNAGPYQNPMEKCMLNAFRKIYTNEDEPDPTVVYDAIENSIIDLHAKRTNTGVKYTKHGENIRSALENLRGILARPEFSTSKGVKFEDLIHTGAVFNISNASGTTRAYLYALILNQAYAITSSFDTNGDDELRLLICLEEAQTMFGDKDSAAVQDIKQRIQDFRRQGIGLMLLTHNVSDIDSGIRRLCQSKLYLKQASDMAAIASKDIIFTFAAEDEIPLKLKLLDSRTGAFSYITKEGKEKMTQDTIFVRTKEYSNTNTQMGEDLLGKLMERNALKLPEEIDAIINIGTVGIDLKTSKPIMPVHAIRFKYLGEIIAEHAIEPGRYITERLVAGKNYKLQLIDWKGRLLKEVSVTAKNRINLSISEDGAEITNQN